MKLARSFAFALPLLLASSLCAGFQDDPAKRKEGRPPELWRFYQHGVADFFAAPLEASFPKAPAERDSIETPYFKAGIEAVRVDGDAKFSSRELPLDIVKMRGRKLRIFYWMKGESSGRSPTPNSYGDVPALLVTLKDGKGRQLSKIGTHNGAFGSFPWHGYYLDVQIPPEAAKAFLDVEGSESKEGSARFGRFGWELVGKENEYSQDEKQDPETGSLAAFPWYEPINFHFFAKPPAYRYRWNFLRGPAAGMKGQPYDLTTLDGLRRYYSESVKVDLDQMNHGIMYFPARYRQGLEHGVLPEMEPGWLEELSRLILEDQDPETGYWGTRSQPKSMSVTFHFVDMLFAFGVERTDSPATPDPGRCISPSLPRAEAMARSTLKLQSTCERDGRKELAAWSQDAYNFTENPDRGKSRCALGSTMNAIRLLRVCRRFAEPETRLRIDASVEAAFRYVLERCVSKEGLWKQEDADAGPSKPAYFGNILNYSRYLEKRVDANVPKPSLKIESRGDGALSLRCESWPEGLNSVRIYALAPGEGPERLLPDRIEGIVSRSGERLIELDPFIAVRRCAAASRANWGAKLDEADSYIGRKAFKELKEKLPSALGSEPLELPKGSSAAGKRSLWAVGVDWYGRESEATELKL